VVWDGARGAVLFSTIDEGGCSGSIMPARHQRVSPLIQPGERAAIGANGELFGAQEGGRRLVEFTPDGRTVPVDACSTASIQSPSDLVVDRSNRIYFTDPRHPVIPFDRRSFRSSIIAPCCARAQ